jgi:repressor LexA
MDLGKKIKNRRLELGLTLEEIGEMVGVGKSTVMKWETGYIENMKRDKIALLAKALKVSPLWVMGLDVPMDKLPEGLIPIKTKMVPLLGKIAAGEPIMMCEELSPCLVSADDCRRVDFCLKVKGDSMIDARINNGDIVFIRKQPTVENGEIAAVVIDDEATLKRFYKNNGGIILKPENAKYQPKYYTAEDFKDIRILGKAIFFQSEVH